MPDKISPAALGHSQNQNLINPTRVERIEGRGKPPGFYKSIILDVVGIISAFFVGYAYFDFLQGEWSIVAPLSMFFLFTVVLTLETLIGKSMWRRVGILLVEVAAMLVPFYAFDVRILGVSIGIAFVLLFAGHLEGHGELTHGTTIRFFRSTHGIVAKSVTASILVAIILYLPAASAGLVFIGESGFKDFFDWTASLVANYYPAISFTGSFDDFAKSVAREEFTDNTNFRLMSSDDQNAVLSAAAIQIEQNLSKSLNVNPAPTTLTSDVAYNAIKNLLQEWRSRFSVWFTVAWGIVLFLTLRSIGVVAVWIGQILSMIVYELLLAADIVRIKEEPQTKEVVEF
jgi:hypothetical protein